MAVIQEKPHRYLKKATTVCIRKWEIHGFLCSPWCKKTVIISIFVSLNRPGVWLLFHGLLTPFFFFRFASSVSLTGFYRAKIQPIKHWVKKKKKGPLPCLVAKPATPTFICCAPFLLIAWFKSFLLWTLNCLSFTSFCFNSICRREWFASFPRFLILFDVDDRGVSVGLCPELCIIIIPFGDSSAVAGATHTRVPAPWVTIGGNKM